MPLGDPQPDFSIMFDPAARARVRLAALRGEAPPPVADELAKALEHARGASDLANLLAASGDPTMQQLAHGIQHQADQAVQVPEMRLRYAKEAEQARQMTDKATRLRDPGSKATVLRRALAQRLAPDIDTSEANGADLEDALPLLEKAYMADAVTGRALAPHVKLNTVTGEYFLDRPPALPSAGAARGTAPQATPAAPAQRRPATDLNDPFAGRPADQLTLKTDKLLQAFGKDLDPYVQARSAFGQNAQIIRKARGLKQLLAHGNNLDPRQREEIAIGLASLLSGSNAPSDSTIKNLVPESAVGNASKMAEWFVNEPLGTNQQKFIERIADTVDREEKVALANIIEEQKGVMPKHAVLFKTAPRAAWDIMKARGLDKYYGRDFQPLAQPGAGSAVPAEHAPSTSAGPKVVERRTINGRTLEKLADGSIREVK